MAEIAMRFLVGGLMVSVFSLISDLFKPKSFAGLFGAAPSVALASLTITILTKGKETAAMNAQSMAIGAVALLLYAWGVGYLLLRRKMSPLATPLWMLLFWLGAAGLLWLGVIG